MCNVFGINLYLTYFWYKFVETTLDCRRQKKKKKNTLSRKRE